ncbi:V-type proton ATPase subunit S1b isoform X1 [Stegostoma tigrinum]|uniref:V-type proton ATPase subunit S1b isoform X1 n=2 Tax=Stegostoma tigrinum TaxID=3053191 RepID=UPI00202B62DE|nr:V-type proton ATPase subunit S1b isoform X1 [Stegostoma tigrinum]
MRVSGSAMDQVHCLQFLFYWALVGLPQGNSAVEHVPVLMWSNFSSLRNMKSATYEGQIIKIHELQTFLKPIFKQDSQNIILFLQNELSVEDFTCYGPDYGNKEIFYNIQQLLESSNSSLILPAVDQSAIKHLQENQNWTKAQIDQLDVSELEINPSKPNLIIINLAAVDSSTDSKLAQTLMDNDKVIGMVINTLRKKGLPFSGIYTALRSNVVIRKTSNEVVQTGRRLMTTDSFSSVLYPPLNVTNGTNTCILFHATSLQLTANGTLFDLTNKTFISNSVDSTNSICSTTNSTLSLKYSLQKNPLLCINTLEIRFLMRNKFYPGSARNWFKLDFVEIVQDELHVAVFNVSGVSAPQEYSFHCQLVGTSWLNGVTFIPANKAAKAWTITISEFQIQGFNVENNLFSYAVDCTAFFTHAIWMALVTSLVLLCILTYGIHMIMQLTTNDRFDDPKGQALTVPQTD